MPIAHHPSAIRDADHVLVIDDGEIIEQGTYQELLDKRGFTTICTSASSRGRRYEGED